MKSVIEAKLVGGGGNLKSGLLQVLGSGAELVPACALHKGVTSNA